MAIDRYIETMRQSMDLSQLHDPDMLEELRAHLEDAACDLQLAGCDPLESERRAAQRLGHPESIIAAARVDQLERPRLPARRTRSLAGALLVAATLIVLGGSAVTSANVQPSQPSLPRVSQLHNRV